MRRLVLAALAGATLTPALAPFELFPLALVSLAGLVFLLAGEARARAGFLLGFGWGLGAFGSGVSWLYVALARFGGMPPPLAVLAVALFCAFLALYPALVAAAFVRLRRTAPSGSVVLSGLLFAGLWVGAEWLRGVLFTGFPWLAVGYSQTPPSPLAGLMPVVGVYGVGGVMAWMAAALALAARGGRDRATWRPALAVAAIPWIAGALLGRVQWTAPEGAPLSVALVQTNVEQHLKWRPEHFAAVLQTNARLVRDASAQLVVLPETTLPALAEQLPNGYLELLGDYVRANGGSLVLGVFSRDAGQRIYNAALSFGEQPGQFYAKRHLVPFGEYSPPLFGWFYRLVNIPMSDQTRGPEHQAPMVFGEHRVALNICYEDLFGAEIVRSLPEATLLLNLSNLAWYGDSLAQPQHLQIARVRALESGRPMLRATNTGMTAVVQPDGMVSAVLPAFEQGVLRAEVRGYSGLTPYARWGDGAALALAALALVLGIAGAALRVRPLARSVGR
ncbi:apolipoprotein N-acyltransferase [Azoarcus olearius]|uniref:Apolipoprotein N-acyltransferase n=1 Tax=Azoarcus sp. (strain BH72) TaxID=418699 RepID=A1K3J4_AZOSB|nr:apolipoprotein N-acyltransferase [Azoarcus olearius]CAL93399.1 putative apolipoprotein N-acyltransferase [Azoarcus olearius]